MKKFILIISVAAGALTLSLFLRAFYPWAHAQQSNQTLRAPTSGATPSSTSGSTNSKLGYFDYADASGGIKAKIFLPESMGEWAVENPWRDSEKSLIKEPRVFVKANFQSIAVPAFYGLVRVVNDLQGYDCGTVFTKLSELDGLKLQKYSDTAFEGVKNGKLYVFEYSSMKKDLIVGSKALCDNKTGIEVLVIAPNDVKYKDPVNSILKTVELTIPATPVK